MHHLCLTQENFAVLPTFSPQTASAVLMRCTSARQGTLTAEVASSPRQSPAKDAGVPRTVWLGGAGGWSAWLDSVREGNREHNKDQMANIHCIVGLHSKMENNFEEVKYEVMR